MKFSFSAFALCTTFLAACSGSGDSSGNASAGSSASAESSVSADTTGTCIAVSECDSYTAKPQTLTENGGTGSVTTYGSLSDPETSQGGACNYGETNIKYYAAIAVNVEAGDGKGWWQGGAACGACLSVRVKTTEGWKSAVVRITDKCPDEYCGVDLGGAPARDLMGIYAGRYEGEWKFVPCTGHPEVYGDSTSLYVKDGANAYWSLIQVRNPPDAVTAMAIYRTSDSSLTELSTATEADNFWSVPASALQDSGECEIRADFRGEESETWSLPCSGLAVAGANYYLK